MERSFANRLLRHSFWLSVLFHLLLLFCFATVILYPAEKPIKAPTLQQVPAYVYKGAIKPTPLNNTASKKMAEAASKTKQEPKNLSKSKYGLSPKAIWSSTRSVLQASQMEAVSSIKASEPIYLIGDENEAADPLIRLVGQSLSAHFKYPEVAGRFGIKGRVLVGMTLHPEGYFTNVTIVSSSHNEDLDGAALYAVNKAPLVYGADRFLSAPKHLVVGFIFR